jgi:hypothetical protein
MTNNTLTIGFLNLETRINETITIKASNAYMLVNKYIKLNHRIMGIDSYRLTNKEWNAGNDGMNAGAYLHEILEEMLGQEIN